MAASTVMSPEPLLTFTEVFDFKKFARDHLSKTSAESARLIGQERDGSILFAWDLKNNVGDRTTNIGLYQKNMSSFLTIFQHDTMANIVSATINADRTLLVYTVETTEQEETILYDSFIVEIKPQNRVFTLNLTGSDFRKIQFIYPEGNLSSKSTRSQQVSLLLVVVPTVFVGLYKIKMQATRDGAVMATQPDKQTILKNFVWYQWDPNTQYLYHARFETATTREQAVIGGQNTLMLNCTRFLNESHHLVFIVPLPLPYNVSLYTRSTTFYQSPFSLTLPVREMNLQILHRRDGFWCACLQHCTGWSPDPQSTSTESSTACKIDYSVFLFHNSHVMYGQVPMSVPADQSLYVHFMLIGSFVVAYIPGFMLHLLNVGPRVDPCHHLTFGPDHSLFLPKHPEGVNDKIDDVAQSSVSLTSAVSFSLSGDYSIPVIDVNSSVIYNCSLDAAGFLTLFKQCKNPEMMEDLLHLVIVGLSNPGMAMSMIEHVCRTPMSFSDHKLFAEFLIASSFANIHLEARQFIVRQLPLTMSPTFQGKVYKNEDGVKLAYLKISFMKSFVKQLLVQSNQKLVAPDSELLLNHSPNPDETYETLCFNAVINQSKYTRIDMRALSLQVTETQQAGSASPGSSRDKNSSKKKPASKTTGTSTGIFHKISSTLGRKQPSLSQSLSIHNGKDPQEMLWFLDSDDDILDDVSADGAQVRERMLATMAKDLPLRAKNVVYNTNLKYYAELQRQSCNLLLTIWSALGFSVDSHPLQMIICRSPSPKEQIFHELLEAYLLAHLEIGLHPPSGFHTLYNSMVFMCLDRSLFLQHLYNGALTPTRRFVDMLLEDCQEDDAEIVFQIFNGLEYRLAEYALERWRDPTFVTLVGNSKTQVKDKSKR